MEESKMIEIIRNIFDSEKLDDEDINLIIKETNKNKLTSEKEIIDYLNWIKEEMPKRIIDDSEFDEK